MISGPDQLRDWMRRRGFKPAEACRFLGLDPADMSKFLSGKRTPGLETAIRFERLTGITVEAWSSNDFGNSPDPDAPEASKSTR
jgi:plasmid maintenance system antidote protein VapI